MEHLATVGFSVASWPCQVIIIVFTLSFTLDSLSLIFWPLSTPIRFTVSFTTFDPTKITLQMGNNSLFHPIWWCSCLKIRFSNNGNMSKWSKGWGQLQIPIYKTGLGGSLLQEVYFWKVLTCLVIVCKLILCLTCKDDLGVLHLARYLVISFSVRMYSHALCVYFGGGYEDCLYRPYQ